MTEENKKEIGFEIWGITNSLHTLGYLAKCDDDFDDELAKKAIKKLQKIHLSILSIKTTRETLDEILEKVNAILEEE